MPAPDALRKLRNVLAQLYPDKVSAERMADDIGISIATVAVRDRMVDYWREILKEAQKHNRLALLLEVVGEEYGDNPDFRTARELLRDLLTPPPAATAPRVAAWQLVHPYPMPPHFSGRVSERRLLSEWLEKDSDQPLLQVRALGGFGKSALAWHWLTHDVDPARWPQVLWWSFYESDSNFENFLRETVIYLGSDPTRIAHHRQAVDELLRHLTRPGTLLILDGFERALRAYSSLAAAYQGDEAAANAYDLASISLHADDFLRRLVTLPHIHSKVLLTTRLTPLSLVGHGGILLQGCCELELRDLHPADAVTLFRRLGVRGTRSEIENACAAYGFHPLSLRLLAGLVLKDLQQPGDIGVSRRLDLTGNLVQRQHHVLEQAYTSLPPSRRQLLSILACFRSPVEYAVLKAIRTTPRLLSPELVEENKDGEPVKGESIEAQAVLSLDFDNDLHDLLERGLVQRDERNGRFDLHPIVRRYAYDRFGGQQRRTAHRQLRDYFEAIEVPKHVRTLAELTPLIELYHHTVRAEQYDQACDLFYDRLSKALYYQFGAYQLVIELLRTLFPAGEAQPPRLHGEGDRAWTLNDLACSYSLSGQPHRAVQMFEASNKIYEKLGNKQGVAIDLNNLGDDQLKIGALQVAEVNLRRSVDLSREIGDAYVEAASRQFLGRLLVYRGVWSEAADELATALTMFEEQKEIQYQGVVTASQALYALLQVRAVGEIDSSSVQAALDFARQALALADEYAHIRYPVERDYVRAHWILGVAQRANSDPSAAERHLSEALTRCRTINVVEHEANILIDLARLRRDQGQADAALELVNEALPITERCGYVLQGADAYLLLAELMLAAGNIDPARTAAQKARNLAYCDGPPYTYHVAYVEAAALLARLG